MGIFGKLFGEKACTGGLEQRIDYLEESIGELHACIDELHACLDKEIARNSKNGKIEADMIETAMLRVCALETKVFSGMHADLEAMARIAPFTGDLINDDLDRRPRNRSGKGSGKE
jgi:hypothetical protein